MDYKNKSMSVDKLEWVKPIMKGKVPLPRVGHSCGVIGNKIYYFGGDTGKSVVNETIVLDTGTHILVCFLFLFLFFFLPYYKLYLSCCKRHELFGLVCK